MSKEKTVSIIILAATLMLSVAIWGIYLLLSGTLSSYVTSAEDHLRSFADEYIHERYDDPYHRGFNWSDIMDEWDSDELPLGTMDRYLREAESMDICTDGMTLYDKDELVGYLEDSRAMVQLPGSKEEIPTSIFKKLLELHEDYPVEVILREPDDKYGRAYISVVYKVRDQEGDIEYLHVVFDDAYGLSRFYPGDGSLMKEYGTDESGQTIVKRVKEDLEVWTVYQLNEYNFTDLLERQ